MSGGTINVPIVFRGPNGAAAGVAAQHSQVCFCPHCVTLVALAPCSFLLREHKDIG
jgi:pyruvate dehydrogenase E1 component beta subunit